MKRKLLKIFKKINFKKIIFKKKKKINFKKFLKKLLIGLKNKKYNTLLINKRKELIEKKERRIKRRIVRRRSKYVQQYNIFNSVKDIYKNIKYISKYNNINGLNKKRIDVLKEESRFCNNINSFFMDKYHLPFFVLNANISVIGNYKRYGLIKQLRQHFIYKSLYEIVNNYWSIDPIITRSKFFIQQLKWFSSINRREPITFNLNNIIVISYELSIFLNNLSINYFNFFNKLILLRYSFILLIHKLIKCLLFNKKNEIIIKLYNQFFKKIKLYIVHFNKFQKLYKFYWYNFKKLNLIYKKYFNIRTLLNFKYREFSFSLKKRRKKKNKWYHLYYAKKKRNIIYIINNIIYKFFYYIFLYWFNIYIIYNLKINNVSLFLNKLYVNNNYIILINFYNNFYQQRYRRRFKYKKIEFLDHLQNNKFLLYYKNIVI